MEMNEPVLPRHARRGRIKIAPPPKCVNLHSPAPQAGQNVVPTKVTKNLTSNRKMPRIEASAGGRFGDTLTAELRFFSVIGFCKRCAAGGDKRCGGEA
jgi:hypothetical protein